MNGDTSKITARFNSNNFKFRHWFYKDSPKIFDNLVISFSDYVFIVDSETYYALSHISEHKQIKENIVRQRMKSKNYLNYTFKCPTHIESIEDFLSSKKRVEYSQAIG